VEGERADMSMEVGRPFTVVSPRTGEVIGLDAPIQDLGGWLADVREQESLLREAKSAVQSEVLARMDKDRRWTVHAGGYKLESSSAEPTEGYDELALRSALLDLVDEGELTVEAVDRAVEVVVTYKAKKAGIAALKKGGGRVAEIVAEHARLVEKRRYVTVTRD
jgi:hypothetical protein